MGGWGAACTCDCVYIIIMYQNKLDFVYICTTTVLVLVAMQKPLCLTWDTPDFGGVHHFKSKMHS